MEILKDILIHIIAYIIYGGAHWVISVGLLYDSLVNSCG